jgi:hypothetical protein
MVQRRAAEAPEKGEKSRGKGMTILSLATGRSTISESIDN